MSLRLAIELGFPLIKVGSGELTCLPLHEEIAATGRPVLLSCGMATADEIRVPVACYREAGTELLLLHCVTAYPAPENEVNLRSIPFLNRTFQLPVGFSDHTRGYRAACLAVACGAVLIEKHLTLDHDLPGPDHKASSEPAELAELVKRVRETETILGAEGKFVTPSEREIRDKVRKSIVLAKAASAGHTITRDDVTFRRPGTGISPVSVDVVLGKTVARNLPHNHIIRREDLLP